MNVTLEQRGAVHGLRLEGDLTIYVAATLKSTVQDALAKASELEIDLAGVTEIDTAGVQLLISAKQTANELGQVMRLVNHSATVLELIELYDLAGWFGDALVLPAAEGAAA